MSNEGREVSRKVEEGVLVMKGALAWGVIYADGHSTSYGWVSPCEAKIRDPQFCTKPTDVTYEGSPYVKELQDAKVVRVVRETVVKVVD